MKPRGHAKRSSYSTLVTIVCFSVGLLGGYLILGGPQLADQQIHGDDIGVSDPGSRSRGAVNKVWSSRRELLAPKKVGGGSGSIGLPHTSSLSKGSSLLLNIALGLKPPAKREVPQDVTAAHKQQQSDISEHVEPAKANFKADMAASLKQQQSDKSESAAQAKSVDTKKEKEELMKAQQSDTSEKKVNGGEATRQEQAKSAVTGGSAVAATVNATSTTVPTATTTASPAATAGTTTTVPTATTTASPAASAATTTASPAASAATTTTATTATTTASPAATTATTTTASPAATTATTTTSPAATAAATTTVPTATTTASPAATTTASPAASAATTTTATTATTTTASPAATTTASPAATAAATTTASPAATAATTTTVPTATTTASPAATTATTTTAPTATTTTSPAASAATTTTATTAATTTATTATTTASPAASAATINTATTATTTASPAATSTTAPVAAVATSNTLASTTTTAAAADSTAAPTASSASTTAASTASTPLAAASSPPPAQQQQPVSVKGVFPDANTWPITPVKEKMPGNTIHTLFTSNGSPYQNIQARIMVGTYNIVRAMPGGERLVALTRILHRTTPDEVMDEIPTFIAQPLQPECDKWCWFPVADRANAVQQWLNAAEKDTSLVKAPWLLLLETDYVWVKPLPDPGNAYDRSVPGWSFGFDYIAPSMPIVVKLLKERCPDCDPNTVPNSGPAPVLARFSDFKAATPIWEELSLWIETHEDVKKVLGWVREMYAWDIGVAANKLNIKNQGSPGSPLISQPPHDRVLGNASMYHYTWGTIYKKPGVEKEIWMFDKRTYTLYEHQLKLPAIPMPPAWTSDLSLQDGVKVTQELHDTVVDMLTHMNMAITNLPDLTPIVAKHKAEASKVT